MTIQPQPQTKGTLQGPPTTGAQREFEIVTSCNSRICDAFELSITTHLSREETYELMRTRYVPIALDNIQPEKDGFVLKFPDHISSRFAGDFFHAYWAGCLSRAADPIIFALAMLGGPTLSENEGILDPQFYAGIIGRYYEKIDAGDAEWVIQMFAPHAQYYRADTTLKGHAEIAEFYRSGRKIRGEHMIDAPVVSGDTVIVRGVFNGVGADGSPKHVRFADMWRFEGRLVAARETYLALGSNYVRS